MENEVIENEVVEVANDTTEDNQIDYKAKFEEADKEAKRLNSLIQNHKKKPKIEKKKDIEGQQFGEANIIKMLDEREFYNSNPDMAEHKEAISKFTSTGEVSLEQAKRLVVDANPDIVARQNTQKSNFTSWTPDFSKTEYSVSDLEGMSQFEYEKVMDLKDEGKVKIT